MTYVNDTTVTIGRRALVAIAAALALSLGVTSQARAADCKPNVRVVNHKGASIKVLRFLYTVGGQEFSESLADKRLAVSETEDWPSQRLNGASVGQVITSSRVEFKNDTSGVGSPIGDPYGPPVMSRPFPHSFQCNDLHNYIHDIN